MQKQSLIPTPLNPAHNSRKAIEIVEPTLPARFRFISILLFIFGTVLRSIFARLNPPWARVHATPLLKARRLRGFMEQMGGLWVKAGQIVALRRDLFDEEFCAELTRLQDRARGFPLSYTRRIFEEDLGKPLEEVFEEFDEAPLAAASIGQAYTGRLRGSHIEIVFKVQRPNIVASFQRDLRYLYILVWLLVRSGAAAHFRWDDMYLEIEHAILDELDYRQEATSLRRMRKQLRRHKIYVPKVFLEFCTDRILVMENVKGVYMAEFIQVIATEPERARAWLAENDIQPKKAGERLLFSHFRQLMEDNFYHCDLHPGNILLMRKNRITLIDFGSVGSTDKTQLIKQLHMWIAIGNGDYNKLADLYKLISPSLPDRDLSEMNERFVQLYREYESRARIKSMPYHQKSIGYVGGLSMKIIGDMGIAASWEMLRAVRAELTLDASLMYLMPEIDYLKTLRKYVRQMRERQQKQSQGVKPIRTQIARLSEQADMPTKLAENAYFEGEYLRKRARKYEGYLSKAAKIVSYLFFVLSRGWMLAAVAALLVLLHQRYHILYRFRATSVYGFLERLPQLDSIIWLIASGAALYLASEMAAIKHVLEQPEANRTGGDRR